VASPWVRVFSEINRDSISSNLETSSSKAEDGSSEDVRVINPIPSMLRLSLQSKFVVLNGLFSCFDAVII
jgi:hypothetical protein